MASSSSPSVTAPAPRVKVMCSYGGQILLLPGGKKYTYVGGINRIVKLERDISFPAIISRLCSRFSLAGGCVLKYEIPGVGLTRLVSVSDDDDLENMMEEYDDAINRISPSGSERSPLPFRLFLDGIAKIEGPSSPADAKSEIGGAAADMLQLLAIADDDKKKKVQESASDGTTDLVYLGEYVVPRVRDLPLPVALPEIVKPAGSSSSVTPSPAQAAKEAYDRGVQVAYDSAGKPIYYRAPLNAL